MRPREASELEGRWAPCMPRERGMHTVRLARVGTALLCAVLPISGCVCEQGKKETPGGAQSRELAIYDFVHQPEVTLLSFWPAGPGVPGRKKRQLLTRQEGSTLIATVDGPDPFFVWDFEKPVRAGVLSVELESDTAAPLQLFWANEDCKVYEERCSTTVQLATGKQSVDYVLDTRYPVRGLRLDLPEVHGAKLVFHSVRLLERPRVASGFAPRVGHTEAVPTPEGLRISSKTPDPWLVFSTPWLHTERVERVELTLRTKPDAKPELFWQGTECPSFQEKCRVELTRLDAGDRRFAAELSQSPGWRGVATELRLDPGDPPGDYLLEELVLVRKGASQ